MIVKETKTKKQLIDMAVKISSCNDDDLAMEAVELLMNPVNDRVKMGEAYVETIGYNPIIAFDEDDLSRFIEEIVLEANPDLGSSIQSAKDDLVKKALAINELRRDSHLRDALAEAATLVLGPEMAFEFQNLLLGAQDPNEDEEETDETVDEEEEDDVDDEEGDDGITVTTF